MSGWGWGLLGIIYLVLLFTVAIMTFRKGHWVLGIIGFFFPILWIIGRSCRAGATPAERAPDVSRARPGVAAPR
jgi:uncharacterized membrane protein